MLSQEEDHAHMQTTQNDGNITNHESSSSQQSDQVNFCHWTMPLLTASPVKDDTYQLPNDSGAYVQSWSRLKSKFYYSTYKWTIENFSYYSREKIEGKTFSPLGAHAGQDLGFMWSLELFPKFRLRPIVNEKFLALRLRLNPTEEGIPIKLKVIYHFAILDKNGKFAFEEGNSVDEMVTFNSKDALVFARYRFIPWNELIQNHDLYLPNDTLTIYSEIKTLGDMTREGDTNDRTCSICRAKMSYDFGLLLQNEKFADMTFVIINEAENSLAEFPAHKSIIFTRFPYFRAIISKSYELNQLFVSDVEPEVFKVILQFIYSGAVKSLQQFDRKLLIAAIKFDLRPLKRICEKSISANLTSETVSELFIFSALHKESYLQTKCIEYMRRNFVEVFSTDGWKQLQEEHPQLVKDVFNRNLQSPLSTI